jgi:hypothetical protein
MQEARLLQEQTSSCDERKDGWNWVVLSQTQERKVQMEASNAHVALDTHDCDSDLNNIVCFGWHALAREEFRKGKLLRSLRLEGNLL